MAYVAFISAALEFQPVYLLVNNLVKREEARKALGSDLAKKPFPLHILEVPTNDSWIRDYGGITVEAKNVTGDTARLITLSWTFNSWGGKYPPWDKDNAVPARMAQERDREVLDIDFVLEGGSIDVNGKGLLLTTEQCLLNPNRNPQYNRDDIERILNGYLGVTDVLWLESGIAGDDTDGHVDDLARFVNESTIFCAVETDPLDENYAPLQNNLKALKQYAQSRNLTVIEIPMPARLVKADLRTPATYLNFLILNGGVLVPVFHDARDQATLECFKQYFPHRKIVPIDCRALVFGQGAIHCSSMQVPEEI